MGIPELILGLDKELKGLVCSHCGYQGKDVVRDFDGCPTCRDRVVCWQRFDQQHGTEINLEGHGGK